MSEKKRLSTSVKLALVGAGVAIGAIGAASFSANAANSTSTGTTGSTSSTSSTTQAPPSGQRPAGAPRNDHGSAPVRSDEKAVSATIEAKLKAAALKAVPGGTVYRVETDSGDAAYEAHMTKSDGTEVTVKFDKTYAVTGVESGMGK
jgi:hypothetical protein